MASSDDLILVYERRLADFEARLAAIEKGRERRPVASAEPAASRRGASGFRLGVDVGGTFTDLLLLDEKRERLFTAKVPSTPSNSSIGVLNGIQKICREAGIDPTEIDDVMHGTTVATNTVLTKAGALVGLVTTKGYRDVLQIARSYVPGGLGGWVIYNKAPPLAPLELTIEATERIAADGQVLIPLDEAALRRDLKDLSRKGIEALTVSLFNAYVDGRHERRVAEIAAEIMPSIPVSISSDVIPEMYEYERAETTVVNSYIRPVVSKYIDNLEGQLSRTMKGIKLHILRSDGGLASAQLGYGQTGQPADVRAGRRRGRGAVGIAGRPVSTKLLTFDMGGTSTDVALIQNGTPQTRRETRVGDVTVRAPSIDVRTVGAGGGSIAYVPELTERAARRAPVGGGGAGPAAYRKGGETPTVTDANVVLGYLPSDAKLGGDMIIDRGLAEKAVAKIADASSMICRRSGRGHRQYRQREYVRRAAARVGRAGLRSARLRADRFRRRRAAARQRARQADRSWPVIIPPGPGRALRLWRRDHAVAQRGVANLVQRFENLSDAQVRRS